MGKYQELMNMHEYNLPFPVNIHNTTLSLSLNSRNFVKSDKRQEIARVLF